MKRNDELFQLIHSMNGHERGYFKKLSALSGREDNNYLLLFNEIEKQQEYDEKAIKKKFAGKKFIKQLPVAKSYLYKLVLKSLRNYGEGGEEHIQVATLLTEAKVLIDRLLYNQAETVLKKAFKLAKSNDLFNYCLQAISMQLLIKSINAEYGAMAPLQKQQEILLEKERNYIDIDNILHQVRNITTGGGFHSDEEAMKRFGQLASSPLMRSPDEALSFAARWQWYIARMLIGTYYVRGNTEGPLWAECWVADLENYPQEIRNNPRNYYKACVALWSGLIAKGEYNRTLEVIEQWKGMEKKYSFKLTPYLNREFLVKSSMYSVMAYWGAGRFEEGVALVRSMNDEDYLKSLTQDIFFRYLFRFYGALNFFDLSLYKEAGQQLRYIIEEYDPKKMKDVQLKARVLNLIVQYEFKNFRTIPYLITSFKRWCTAQKIADKHINKFCQALLQLCKHDGEKAMEKKLFSAWYPELKTALPGSSAQFVFDSIGIEVWLSRRGVI